MLHQGSIALGEIDLSKYSKMIVHYGTDYSETSQKALDDAKQNGFGRMMLTSADQNGKFNPNSNIIKAAEYTPANSWGIPALSTFELDLTDVDYNGAVFFSADFLGGQFIVIDYIELIP